MMLAVKAIRFLWPFLKEMFLGGKSLSEALRLHLWRSLFVVLFLASVGANCFVWPRLVEISYSHVELKRKYEALRQQCWPNSEPAADAPALTPSAPRASVSDAVSKSAREFFDHIQSKEHKY